MALTKCPFCDAEPEIMKEQIGSHENCKYNIFCFICFASQGFYPTKELAETAWNKRRNNGS